MVGVVDAETRMVYLFLAHCGREILLFNRLPVSGWMG